MIDHFDDAEPHPKPLFEGRITPMLSINLQTSVLEWKNELKGDIIVPEVWNKR
jgi:hypothetical protein